MSPLGADNAQVLTELKNALRPIVGDAVDNPPADVNIAALAEAIYKVLTQDAVVTITVADDTALQTWLTAAGAGSGAGTPPATITGKLT